MNKVLGLVLASVVAMSVATYAGSGCCAAGRAKGDGKTDACSDALSKLNLTDQQKAKLADLKTQCKTAASTSEAREMCLKGMQEVLSPEQYSQWKAEFDKSAKSGGCPFMKSSAAKS